MAPLTQEMLYVDFFRQCSFIIENYLWEEPFFSSSQRQRTCDPTPNALISATIILVNPNHTQRQTKNSEAHNPPPFSLFLEMHEFYCPTSVTL
ncbi:hypothetical protein JHK85_006282 [Glycine max]|uniref:Uncharacterized protein n=1 Tax=Glycine soja TaxID=3848 RepID=A0A445L686_GLYSO|nr:hypothetical protein JHK87_005969 [Glycine soja]KAG5053772.1 hypothetical protein JHK85_006282 [Glycine max]RZC18791.1 hypothetical protein D0Y65_005849 [Glycine soja]